MSDAVSALGGVEYDGVVSVSENALQGMITLRCDLTAPILKETLRATLGLDVPGMRAVLAKDNYAVAWMSPDELFLFVPYESAGKITATLSEGLGQTHNLVVNVSDARAVFALKGDGVRDVLAKITPVDLRPEVLPEGVMCRTRLGQVAGAFWLTDDTTLWVICFRSVAAYVYGVLTDAADKTAQIRYF